MPTQARLEELIARIAEAAEIAEMSGCTEKVKQALEDAVGSGEAFLAPEFLQTAPDRYARRLVYRAPNNRFTVLAMVWDHGQGTPIHDHAGFWCVECVYRGRIKVVSYDLKNDESEPILNFQPAKTVIAGVGEAGALIPPFDHHTIENEDQTPAVTIHVYGGELTECAIFLPTDSGYRKETRQLCYTA